MSAIYADIGWMVWYNPMTGKTALSVLMWLLHLDTLPKASYLIECFLLATNTNKVAM